MFFILILPNCNASMENPLKYNKKTRVENEVCNAEPWEALKWIQEENLFIRNWTEFKMPL